MSRTLTALAFIIAGSVAFAALSTPGCGYRPPVAPESQPEGFAPPPGGPKTKMPDSAPLADRDGDGAVSHNEGREEAKADFRDTVKTGTGWLMGLIGLASVALFIASFFIPTIPKGGAIIGVVSLAALWLARYMLLAYGVLAADILAWSLLGMAAVSLIGGVWTLALWWKRRILYQQGVNMAREGGTRDAVALMAAGHSVAEKSRKSIASALEVAKADPDRISLIKSALRDKGINL
jgi:hypothetical protein